MFQLTVVHRFLSRRTRVYTYNNVCAIDTFERITDYNIQRPTPIIIRYKLKQNTSCKIIHNW